MKYLKMLGLAAVAAMAMAAFTAGSASATTVEVKGVKQIGSVAFAASLKAGTSAVLRDTFGFSQNTCTTTHVEGRIGITSSTGSTVTGPVTTLITGKCTNEPVPTHKGGTLHIAHTSGTNGTVTSSGAEVTTNSPFGTLTCVTGAGTHLGTLTGSAAGHAELVINAQLSCSGISSRWTGTYTVTSPTGLGVVA